MASTTNRYKNTTSDDVLDFKHVAMSPPPGFGYPTSVQFSPVDNLVTFLAPANNVDTTRHLYAMDLETKVTELLVQPPNEGDTEANLSLEEKLRRERQRLMTTGISSYAWATCVSPPHILIPLQGNIYVQDGKGQPLRCVFDKESNFGVNGVKAGSVVIDPSFSPCGTKVAFVQDSEVYVVDADATNGTAKQLTHGARGTGVTNGLADYCAQEEMDRYKGYWWSPDSSMIAFEQVDESHIPQYRIMHQGNDAVGDGAQEDHRYPFAGEANPRVKLGIVSVDEDKSETVWIDLVEPLTKGGTVPVEQAEDLYLARVDWLPDGSLSAQIENREQSEIHLVRFTRTGEATVLLSESSDVWINLHHMLTCFQWKDIPAHMLKEFPEIDPADEDGFFFFWASERTMFQHLYLHYYSSKSCTKVQEHGGVAVCVKQITDGDWMVEAVTHVDTDSGLVFFMGTKDSPLEKHLYITDMTLDACTPVRVTAPGGTHGAALNRDGTKLILTRNSVHHPSCVSLHITPGFAKIKEVLAGIKEVSTNEEPANPESFKFVFPCEHWIHRAWGGDPRVDQLRKLLNPPEFCNFNVQTSTDEPTKTFASPLPAEAPQVKLYGMIYKPDPKVYGKGPYPTIVSVYGGPHAQRVRDAWNNTASMRLQRFVAQGYLVFVCDNRGAARRGLAFEGAMKHRMGTIEVSDQVSGVNYLVSKGLCDRNRVGINGWSYGGYMSAMCLVKAPEVFHVAVSGAPVTHWDGYDTHYTERYMGTPKTNPAGYEEGSVMNHVDNLVGKLMLVHGLIDENVHFRHTARLINALIRARKDYDLLLFPNERHSPRGLQDRLYMEERIAKYFDQHLKCRLMK